MADARVGLMMIGEFSRVSCITPRVLRYYFLLGIHSPEVVDPSATRDRRSRLGAPSR